MIMLEVEFTEDKIDVRGSGLVPGQDVSLLLIDRRQAEPLQGFLLKRMGEVCIVAKMNPEAWKEKEKA